MRIRLVLLALGLLALGWATGCGDDTERPPADEEVQILTASFFPNDVTLLPGRRVRWVNLLSRVAANVRTVTSGTGPDDPAAGTLFNATLQGYGQGETVGEIFVFRFENPGEYPYFSTRPDGAPFTGRVIVQ